LAPQKKEQVQMQNAVWKSKGQSQQKLSEKREEEKLYSTKKVKVMQNIKKKLLYVRFVKLIIFLK